MNKTKEIAKQLQSMSGKYFPYDIFNDWVRIMALALSNATNVVHDRVWREREQLYLETMTKYNKTEQEKLAQMMAWLVETLEDGPEDILGNICMEAGICSRSAGQFFTPRTVSEAMAKILVCADTNAYRSGKKMSFAEPACGSGGMIIYTAKVLWDEGINYQEVMKVVAQDIDWKCVYMTYVQLSLLGIDAICVQGDALTEPYIGDSYPKERVLRTPANLGLLKLMSLFEGVEKWF